MELTKVPVSETVEQGLRLDSHFYCRMADILPLVASREGIALTRRAIAYVTNGWNLPESAYELDTPEPQYWYVSVGALSMFAVRLDRCIPLRDPDTFGYRYGVDAFAPDPGYEFLITRTSGSSPGIAWPCADWPVDVGVAVPSGFVMRVRCNTELLIPAYATAVLNHPLWRTWTFALSTGKSQRNLSQEQLASVRIPWIALDAQEEVGTKYLGVLQRIRAQAQVGDLRGTADRILHDLAGLEFQCMPTDTLSADRVSLSSAMEAGWRIDVRYHRAVVRAVLAPLETVPCETLLSLAETPIIKGRASAEQGGEGEDEGEGEGRLVATVAVQAGQVVEELTKSASEAAMRTAGERLLKPRDLVVAMDGEGSIGKVGVFEGEYDAVPDSHVAILRLRSKDLTWAVACYMTSSLAQAQMDVATSGSTGQTQLSPTDLGRVRIPVSVLASADRIGAAFESVVAAYASVAAYARAAIIEFSAELSELLLDLGAFKDFGVISLIRRHADVASLGRILSAVRAE